MQSLISDYGVYMQKLGGIVKENVEMFVDK